MRRLETVLRDLYSWYRRTRSMERNVHRDRHLVPELDSLLTDTLDVRLDAVANAHAAALGSSASTRALVRLALDFLAWDLLARQGLDDRAIAWILSRAALRSPDTTA